MAPDISKSLPKSVTENDLEHFRQEWRAEVELRKSRAQQLDDHSSQASNARDNRLHVDDSTQTTTLSLENIEHSFLELSLSEQLNREKKEAECDGVPRTALEYYVRAVANEREGNLNEGRD